jgi:hypothetical protein
MLRPERAAKRKSRDIMGVIRHSIVATAVVVGMSVWFGCSSSADDVSADESNLTGSTACKIFNNQTGKPITAAELQKLNDPIAKKLLEGKDCPGSYSAALKKLKGNDSRGCKDTLGGKQVDGLGTFLISETVAHLDDAKAEASTFRTIITKTCEDRKVDDMLFSGSASVAGVSDTNVEMIGKDSVSGVFNYYEVLDGGEWVFYGDSLDFIGDGYECKPSGFCVAKNSKKASSPTKKSCASCHVSGGLIMKELDAPWLHWTGEFAKGSEKVVEAHKATLGNQQTGEELELTVVRPSFEAYNDKRANFLASKGVAELVRPLFCTMDVNLSSGLVESHLIADKALAVEQLQADFDLYEELKKEVRQRINGLPASVTDTASPFTFPSRGEIDIAYGVALDRAKLVDNELLQDILSVDFTRPIFSGQRCALVESIQGKTAALDAKLADFAKQTDKNRKNALAAEIAKAIPALFKAALSAKPSRTPAEEKFLSNLTDPKATADAHKQTAEAFIRKCNTRLSPDVETDQARRKAALKEFMTYASHTRSVMRKDVIGFNGQDLLEGRGKDNKMVTDDIADSPNAFDPDECKLVLPPDAIKATK